jgi:hypothetical protein
MTMATSKNVLPQEGTDRLAVGESLAGPSGLVSPTVSGGGKNRLRDATLRLCEGGEGSGYDSSEEELISADGKNKSEKELLIEGENNRKLCNESQESTDDVLMTVVRQLRSREILVTDSSQRHTVTENDETGARKRPHPTFLSENYVTDTDSEETTAPKIHSMTRGKARSGHRAGLSRAKASLKKLEDDALEDRFEKSLQDRAFRKSRPEAILDIEEEIDMLPKAIGDVSLLNAQELRACAGEKLAAVLEVAKKSGNLKGGYVAKLKESAKTLQEVVESLVSRTETEETRRLIADNNRLHKEVEALKAEVKAHRREFSELKASSYPSKTVTSPSLVGDIIEELKASLIVTLGTMMNARFEGLEERLLPPKVHRPPLAADSRTASTRNSSVVKTKSTPKVSNLGSQVSPTVPQTTNGLTNEGQTPNTAAQSDSWTTVVKKNRKKAQTQTTPATVPSTNPPVPTQRSKPNSSGKPQTRLTPPRTAAVVISLQQSAIEKGVTYEMVMSKAGQEIDLSGLGIESVKFRQAVTGARILEVSGPQGAEKADQLADKLRCVFDGVAKISRPTKCVELRITGLDDSITKEKVIAAVAKTGGCSTDAVKAGEVRTGPGGTGACVVQCPIIPGKVLSDSGRLLVGWTSARVVMLEARPLRCFKCMGIGHTRPKCPSTVDRTSLCFRCGEKGHKSAGCFAEAKCNVCTAAGKHSGHVMGSRNCNPPLIKSRVAPVPQINLDSGLQQAAEEEHIMSEE